MRQIFEPGASTKRAAAPTTILTPGAAHRYESFRTPEFWYHYRRLSAIIQQRADKSFALLKQDPQYPSLRLKKIDSFWSARVGLHYRVLAKERTEELVRLWIGHHSEYDQLLKG